MFKNFGIKKIVLIVLIFIASAAVLFYQLGETKSSFLDYFVMEDFSRVDLDLEEDGLYNHFIQNVHCEILSIDDDKKTAEIIISTPDIISLVEDILQELETGDVEYEYSDVKELTEKMSKERLNDQDFQILTKTFTVDVVEVGGKQMLLFSDDFQDDLLMMFYGNIDDNTQ